MDAKLVALSKRINAGLDRVAEERQHVADIYAEAKSAGYIPKILRKAITRQRMDAGKRQEEDSILDLYDHALGNLGKALRAVSDGATWDEATKATGVPRATLARAAAVSKRREVIPDTEADMARPDMGVPLSEEITVECKPGSVFPLSAVPKEITESSGGVDGHAACEQHGAGALTNAGPIVEAEPMAEATAPSPSAAGVEPRPLDPDDKLEIPHFLRRAAR